MSSKKCQVGSSSKKCPTRVLSKSVLEEWRVRVSSKKCLTRVSSKSVLEECQISVKQGCPTRVPAQCVKSGCSTRVFAGNCDK